MVVNSTDRWTKGRGVGGLRVFRHMVANPLSTEYQKSGNGIVEVRYGQQYDIFDVEYPTNGAIYRYSFNGIVIATYTRPIQQCRFVT